MVDGKEWNGSLVRTLSPPPHISDQIIHTPILNEENERLIWTPSSSGMFSMKSMYNWMLTDRNPDPPAEYQQIWKLIWDSKLHGRHQLLLWKIVQSSLPTLDRIRKFAPTTDPLCYLCGQDEETTLHLLL